MLNAQQPSAHEDGQYPINSDIFSISNSGNNETTENTWKNQNPDKINTNIYTQVYDNKDDRHNIRDRRHDPSGYHLYRQDVETTVMHRPEMTLNSCRSRGNLNDRRNRDCHPIRAPQTDNPATEGCSWKEETTLVTPIGCSTSYVGHHQSEDSVNVHSSSKASQDDRTTTCPSYAQGLFSVESESHPRSPPGSPQCDNAVNKRIDGKIMGRVCTTKDLQDTGMERDDLESGSMSDASKIKKTNTHHHLEKNPSDDDRKGSLRKADGRCMEEAQNEQIPLEDKLTWTLEDWEENTKNREKGGVGEVKEDVCDIRKQPNSLPNSSGGTDPSHTNDDAFGTTQGGFAADGLGGSKANHQEKQLPLKEPYSAMGPTNSSNNYWLHKQLLGAELQKATDEYWDKVERQENDQYLFSTSINPEIHPAL